MLARSGGELDHDWRNQTVTSNAVPTGLHVHPGETDLLVPLPGPGELWDPHLIHTHYFGFSIPEVAIGGFLDRRYQPPFPPGQGGGWLFQGNENPQYTANAHPHSQ